MEKIKIFILNLDFYLITSIIVLIIITPFGLSFGKVTIENRCNAGPLLFIQSDIEATVPQPFKDFVNQTTEFIELVVSQFFPRSDFTDWANLLRSAHDERGVSIHIVTDDSSISAALESFCEVTFIQNPQTEDSIKMLVFFGQSDSKRTIYASRLFSAWSKGEETHFFITFPDCQSLAHDASSLYSLFKYYANKGFPQLFLKQFLPGSTFPNVHHWNENGSCSFGISPSDLTPPGRNTVRSLLNEFFQNSQNDELRVLTPSLFPSVEEVQQDMPEMLLSEKIEKAAYRNSTIQILLTNSPSALTNNSELISLQNFPHVEIRNLPISYSPTFYLRKTECSFMPISFMNSISNSIMTISMNINDEELTAKLRKQFDKFWESSHPI